MESKLKKILYTGPMGGILITEIEHSTRLNAINRRQRQIEYNLKNLRKQFQENITERMVNIFY